MTTIEWIVVVLGLVLTVLNILDKYIFIKKQAKQPFVEHEEQIRLLQSDVCELRRLISGDRERIAELEKGNRITMEAIGALLSHAIDGNNVDELKSAKKEMNRYLYEK